MEAVIGCCFRAEGHGLEACAEVPLSLLLCQEDARRTWLAGGGATLLSSHAGTSPTGDERHSESESSPTADSVKASQLGAGRSLFTKPDVTGPIQTASVEGVAPEPTPRTSTPRRSRPSGQPYSLNQPVG